MDGERTHAIVNKISMFYPDFLSIETEYNLNIRNKVGEVKSTTNVFRKKLPENVILLRFAYDIALIKNMTTNFINNINDDINNYDFDPNCDFSITFKVNNNNISVISENTQNNSDIDTALAYSEFFEALKRYLVAISLEGEYTELKRINEYIDYANGCGIEDFYSFIDYNIDLYSQFDSNRTVTVQNNSIPEFVDFKHYQNDNPSDNNYNSYNVTNYSRGQQFVNSQPLPYYMQKSNGMCIASFVFGILSVFIWQLVIPPLLAFIFGIVGVKNFDIKHEKNKSLGYIGLGFGAFFLVLDVFLIILPILFYVSG